MFIPPVRSSWWDDQGHHFIHFLRTIPSGEITLFSEPTSLKKQFCWWKSYFSTFLLVKSEITILSHHFMRSWTLWPTVNSGPKPCFYWRRPIRGVCDPATVDFQLLAIYGYMEGASWAKNWLMGNGMNEPRIGVCTKQYVTRWDKIFMAQFGSG